jgi:hypothetical protein
LRKGERSSPDVDEEGQQLVPKMSPYIRSDITDKIIQTRR